MRLGQEDWEKVRAAFNAADPFFTSSAAVKSRNWLPEDFGYRPIGVEYSQSPDRPDLAESFSVSIRTRKASELLPSVVAKSLYVHMLAVFEIFEPIAVSLTMRLAEFLGGDFLVHHLPGAFRYWSRLQMNYSQTSQISAPLINDLHEDRDLFTITCATGPGLQVQVGSGEFKSVTTAPGELLILPGEIAWLLSGGYVQPLWHRVVTRPEQSVRKSLLFFGDIDPSLCEPWVRNEVNVGIDIPARVKASVTHFGLKGFDLSEGDLNDS